MMKRHIKIVATLGPASDSKSTLKAMVQAGMNIARLNCSHGNKIQFLGMVKILRELEKETHKTLLTLLDLQGPKIRLGELPPEGIPVKKGDRITFWTGTRIKNNCIPIPYAPLTRIVKKGEALLIEDGLIRTKIVSTTGEKIHAIVEVGGLLKRHKGVNLPHSSLPSSETLSKKDAADLKMGIQSVKVDAVALSFVEKAEDIQHVREKITQLTHRPIFLIAKIERPKALDNLREIAMAADGLMVARGDLGIEIPAEQVPVEQRRILAVGRELGKPVIVATQVLESMTDSPLPTRAEMSDAATAVFEQADAFMLSNETAVGHYPLQAVQTLHHVAESTEKAMEQNTLWMSPVPLSPMNDDPHDHHMASEAVQLAEQIQAKALVVVTQQGYTARAVLRLRPNIPVIAITSKQSTARLLNMSWGIEKIIEASTESSKIPALLKKKNIHGTVVLLSLSKKKRSLTVLDV